jgi:hypothetical protein
MGLAHVVVARHVMGCHVTQEARVENALDDVAVLGNASDDVAGDMCVSLVCRFPRCVPRASRYRAGGRRAQSARASLRGDGCGRRHIAQRSHHGTGITDKKHLTDVKLNLPSSSARLKEHSP